MVNLILYHLILPSLVGFYVEDPRSESILIEKEIKLQRFEYMTFSITCPNTILNYLRPKTLRK